MVPLLCGHRICEGCIKNILKKICPFCRKRFANESRDQLFELELEDDYFDELLDNELEIIMNELNRMQDIRKKKREKRLKRIQRKQQKRIKLTENIFSLP